MPCSPEAGIWLAVPPIEKVAHGVPPSGVEFGIGLGSLAAVLASCRLRFVPGAAFRAAVGETGLVGLQLELLRANAADFDWKGHAGSPIFACSIITDEQGCPERVADSGDMYIYIYAPESRPA